MKTPNNFTVLDALKVCPYTSYRIASETGITQASIQNYRTGRSRPNPAISRILATYFRLDEFWQKGTEMSYIDFFEEYGVSPLVEPRPSTVGFIEGYTPKQKNIHDQEDSGQTSIFPQDKYKPDHDETIKTRDTKILSYLSQFPGTMYELSVLSGISQGALLKIKRGESKPTLKTLRALMLALRISEFKKYQDDEKKAGRVPLEYNQFMQEQIYDDESLQMIIKPENLPENKDKLLSTENDDSVIKALYALVFAQQNTIQKLQEELNKLKLSDLSN